MHFQTWSDVAGHAVSPPVAPLTDPTNGLTFPDLNSAPFGGDDFETELIMPEPCPFLSPTLPVVSVIRPTETKGAAMGALKFLTDMASLLASRLLFSRSCKASEDADQAHRER